MVGIFEVWFILAPAMIVWNSLDTPLVVGWVLVHSIQGILYDIVPLQGLLSWHQCKGAKCLIVDVECWIPSLGCNSGSPSVVEQ